MARSRLTPPGTSDEGMVSRRLASPSRSDASLSRSSNGFPGYGVTPAVQAITRSIDMIAESQWVALGGGQDRRRHLTTMDLQAPAVRTEVAHRDCLTIFAEHLYLEWTS